MRSFFLYIFKYVLKIQIYYATIQVREISLGPEVNEDAPMKCEPWCEAVNMEDHKGGNLP